MEVTNKEVCCRHCGEIIKDLDDCSTEKYWDDDGNHILYHLCPACGEILEEVHF